MTTLPPETNTDKVRQQYDFLPYPESHIEHLPANSEQLFVHSLATPYYLRYQKVINTNNKVILDAGCGSGLQSLVLALANPGARIIGVDISERSIEIARQRFAYHQFTNAEFHACSLTELLSLGYQFDYINCDEVLYLLPDPAEMLQIFRSVLAPEGIVRANLHSYYQRAEYFRQQETCRFLGLFNEESVEVALETVKETIANLKNYIRMKSLYQDFGNNKLQKLSPNEKEKQLDSWIMTNYLLQGDKGYTIPDLFNFLESANLDFLSMVDWRGWNILDLFQDPDNLPLFWQLGLESATEADKLHLFELFQPIHRLLDFWCMQKNDRALPVSPMQWTVHEWQSCFVHLHPVLQVDKVKESVLMALEKQQSFVISQYIPLPAVQPVMVESSLLACLLPLWDGPQYFRELVARWLRIQPLVVETLEPKTEQEAEQELIRLLTQLETYVYVLLERF